MLFKDSAQALLLPESLSAASQERWAPLLCASVTPLSLHISYAMKLSIGVCIPHKLYASLGQHLSIILNPMAPNKCLLNWTKLLRTLHCRKVPLKNLIERRLSPASQTSNPLIMDLIGHCWVETKMVYRCKAEEVLSTHDAQMTWWNFREIHMVGDWIHKIRTLINGSVSMRNTREFAHLEWKHKKV